MKLFLLKSTALALAASTRVSSHELRGSDLGTTNFVSNQDSIDCNWHSSDDSMEDHAAACLARTDGHTVSYTCDGKHTNVCCTLSGIHQATIGGFGKCLKVSSEDFSEDELELIEKGRRNGGGKRGGQKDSHGCVSDGGYSWCESEQKCYRPWEETCETQSKNECGTATGYSWCESKQKCLRIWEEDCPTTPIDVPYNCDGAKTSMLKSLRMYTDGWMCSTDGYGVEQALGLSTDGQLEFWYNQEKVWSPSQRRAGSYVALDSIGKLQVHDTNDSVVLSKGCNNCGETPNEVVLSNDGGFGLDYHNGGYRSTIWSVNNEGDESGCSRMSDE